MKTKQSLLILSLGLAVISTGCDRRNREIDLTTPIPQPKPVPVAQTETLETHALQKEIDAFEQNPSKVRAAKVKAAFAELDGEIAELVGHVAKKEGGEQREAALKLKNLREYREAELIRFQRFAKDVQLTESQPGVDIPTTPSISDGGAMEQLGKKLDKAARKVGDGVKDAADTIRE